jgi:hypothetical protein
MQQESFTMRYSSLLGALTWVSGVDAVGDLEYDYDLQWISTNSSLPKVV